MSVESAADRAAFLADFGVTVSWQAGVSAAVTMIALFDNGAVTQFGGEVAIANRRATLTMAESDVPAGGDEQDVITVAGVAYHPKSILPDGTGLAVVTLEQVELD